MKSSQFEAGGILIQIGSVAPWAVAEIGDFWVVEHVTPSMGMVSLLHMSGHRSKFAFWFVCNMFDLYVNPT